MKLLKNKLLYILLSTIVVFGLNIEKSQAQVSSIKVVDFPSGVRMKVLKEGDGKRPDEDSNVLLNYRGVLPSGYEFVSTYRIGKPAEINIKKVILCWKNILPYLRPGALVHVYCPAQTAYGDIGVDDLVPANSVLLFEIELVKVLPPNINEDVKQKEIVQKSSSEKNDNIKESEDDQKKKNDENELKEKDKKK